MKSFLIFLILNYSIISISNAASVALNTNEIDVKILNDHNQIKELQDLRRELQNQHNKAISDFHNSTNKSMDELKKTDFQLKENTVQINNLKAEIEVLQQERSSVQSKILSSSKSKIDTVAQVLNYSDGCNDEGCGGYSSWVVRDSKSCIYDKVDLRDGSVIKSLNLNQMDPKSIQVVTMDRASTEREEIKDPKNGFRVIGYNNIVTKYQTQDVQYMGKQLSSQQNLDINRLKRGWSLIYSKYCSGTRKAF